MSRPVAIVTGAGSGIGAAIAVRMAARHDLILTHLTSDDDLQRVVENSKQAGAAVTTVTGDLTTSATLLSLEQRINRTADRLAVSSPMPAPTRAQPGDLDIAAFRRQIELNLITHAACAKLVTPALTALRHGRIIAISTVLTQLGRVDLAGYIAAKSGLEGLIRALARELGPHGVTVNCIRAGSIEVPAEHTVVPDHDAMIARQLDRQCIKRRGQPNDIAAAADFLASRDAGFITGQCLIIDGGWCMT